jgi:septal ring-binding cell division protein DamX
MAPAATRPIIQPAPPPASTATVTHAVETTRREAWLMAQPPHNFTIQILSVGSETAVRDFIRVHDLGPGAAFVESNVKGASVFRLLYGSYATRDLAQKAMAAVPKAGPADAPWVRSVAELQKQLDPRYLKR